MLPGKCSPLPEPSSLAADAPFAERLNLGVVFRVGRGPEPFAWPDWAYAPFEQRYDDPQGVYRVLYTCSQRRGAFVETLSRFRPDAEVYEELAQIEGDEPFLAEGVVPAAWRLERMAGRAVLAGTFADIGASKSLAFLHRELAHSLPGYGIPGLTQPLPLGRRVRKLRHLRANGPS